MARLVVFKKLSMGEALDAMQGIEEWFRENPTRKVCNTDNFTVRRGHLVEDILKRTHFPTPNRGE